MNELSLFTGAFGGGLGSGLLGWRTVGAVEIDPYCREIVLRRQEEGILENFPSTETSVASMAQSIVGKWISSLPDSLANRSPLPAEEREKGTNGICGPKLSVLFVRLDPPIAFSKTSQDSSQPTSNSARAESPIQKYRNYIRKDGMQNDGQTQNPMKDPNCHREDVPSAIREWMTPQQNLFTTSERYCETWRKAGMMLNGVCYLQPNAELPIGEVDCGLWHTPKTSDSANRDMYRNSRGEPQLAGQARLYPKGLPPSTSEQRQAVTRWRTPHASDGEGGVMKMHKDKDGHYKLRDHVQGINREMWPTPRTITGGAESADRKQELGRTESGGGDLQAAVETWPTPRKQMAHGVCKSRAENPALAKAEYRLEDVVAARGGTSIPQIYPTPHGFSKDGISNGPSGNELGRAVNEKTRAEIQKWATPCQSDAEGRGYSTTQGRSLLREAKAEQNEGQPSGVMGQLNPDWVAWLMGWPVGWTSMEPLDREHFDVWVEAIQGGWWWVEDPADLGIVPRVSKDVPHRVNRLKALGNGQVSLCMAMAWRLLSEGWIEEENNA